ncbi:exodeoxyribonuclease V subunit alpha [soil metagenome]
MKSHDADEMLDDRLSMPAERRHAGGVEALAHVLGRTVAALHRRRGGVVEDAAAIESTTQALVMADAAGHSCVPTQSLAEFALDRTPLASIAQAAQQFARSPVTAGAVDQSSPLAIDGQGRVYLRRHWLAEERLARAWTALDRRAPVVDDTAAIAAALDRWFPPQQEPVDWQRAAAATALLRGACVISGGPGTGKTTTVVRALLALVDLAPGLRCVLAAPTGKAAARLQESLQEQCARLGVPQALRERLPSEALTVHRLLSMWPDGRRRHDGPVHADVVVIDEASMLSLAMAARLLAALKPGCRLILLGDKDQLASVETGLVLAQVSRHRGWSAAAAADLAAAKVQVPVDLMATDAEHDSIVWLERSYRFGTRIGALARAVNSGEVNAARALLDDPAAAAAVTRSTSDSIAELVAAAIERYEPYFAAVSSAAGDVAIVLEAFASHRVLTALHGQPGAAASRSALNLNLLLERQAAIRLDQATPPANGWFHGRPVLVTRNDATLGLVNGDIGVTLADADGQLAVHFMTANGARSYPPGRLPACETAFAMTVHKSQGSEFDSVDIVLPEAGSRIASRELLYTAITRARSAVRIWASDTALAESIERRTERFSGLADRIREQRPTS